MRHTPGILELAHTSKRATSNPGVRWSQMQVLNLDSGFESRPGTLLYTLDDHCWWDIVNATWKRQAIDVSDWYLFFVYSAQLTLVSPQPKYCYYYYWIKLLSTAEPSWLLSVYGVVINRTLYWLGPVRHVVRGVDKMNADQLKLLQVGYEVLLLWLQPYPSYY